jgi:gliding motility-associated-like protein
MKRIIYSCFLLIALLFSKPIAAQVFNFNLLPTALCYTGAGTYTAIAAQTAPAPAANSYSWAINPPIGTSITVAPGTGTSAILSFTACGTYTVTHAAYGVPPNPPQIAIVQSVITVYCPQNASVTATPSNVCAGSQANLVAAGVINATWTAVSGTVTSIAGTGVNIIVTPTATTLYTVTAITPAGCTQTAAITVGVTKASIAASPATTSLCIGAPLNLSSTFTVFNASPYTVGTVTTGISWTPPGSTVSFANTFNTTTSVSAPGGNYLAQLTYSSAASGTCLAIAPVNVTTLSTVSMSVTASAQSVCPGGAVILTGNISPATTVSAAYTWTSSTSLNQVGNPVTFNPSVATQYTANVNYYGCTGTATANVGMQTLSVNLIPSSSAICPLTQVTFTATGGINYTFTRVTPASTVTFIIPKALATTSVVSLTPSSAQLCTSVTVNASAGGCIGSASTTVCRFVLNTQLIPNTPSVCPGGTVALHTNHGCGTTNTIICTSTSQTLLPINNCASNASLATFNTPALPFPYPLCFTATADSAGCKGSANLCIGLLTLTPTLNIASSSICPGSSFTASANGGAGTNYTFTSPYLYPSPSSTTSIISTGTNNLVNIVTPTTVPFAYTYTVNADSAGCVGSISKTIGLLTLTPSLSLSSASGSVCPNSNFTITAHMGAGTNYSFASTYSVLSIGTTTVNSVTVTAPNGTSPTFPQTYTVSVDSAGCVGSPTISVGLLSLSPNLNLTVLPSNTVCPGSTFTLFAQAPLLNTAYTFNFYGPGGQLPSLSTNSAMATSSTNVFNTTYTVVADNNQCQGTQTVTVYQKFLNLTLTSLTPSVCAGQSATLTVGGAGAGSSYTYGILSPGTSTISSLFTNSIIVSPTVQTIYVVAADDAGCRQPTNVVTTATIGIFPTFSLTPSATSSFVCAGLPSTISIATSTSAIPPVTYIWSPPGVTNFGTLTVGSPTATSAVAMPTVNTTYTIDAQDLLGCKAQTVISIGISTVPVLPITISSPNSIICGSLVPNATLTASSSVSPASYTWSPSIGLSSTNSATVIANPAITTVYTAIVDNGYGCKGISTHTVSSVAIPSINIAATSGVICAGYTATLTAFGASSGYTWTSASFTGAILQQTVSVAGGVYTVTGSNGGACINSASIPIQTNTLGLNITVVASPASQTTCIENNNPRYSKPVILTASGANTYVWFPYNPANMTYSLGPSTTVRPPATTNYTVTGATSICSGTAIITITVVPQFTMSVVPPLPFMCKDDSLKLSIVSIGPGAVGPASAYTYSWTDANPITITSKFTQTVLVYPQNTTAYSTQVKDSRGCVSLPKLVTVTVLPRPLTVVSIPTINSIPTNTICFVGLNPGPEDVILTLEGSNKNTNLQFGVVPTYTWLSPYTSKYYSILTPPNNPIITISAPLRLPDVVTYSLISGYNGVLGCKRIDTVSVRVIDCRPLTDVYFETAEKVDTICAQTCITFVNRTDTAAGGVQKVKWTFRGGLPATSTNPIETVCYNLPGKYDVILEVTNPYPKNPPNGLPPGSYANLGKSAFVKVVNIPNVTIFAPGQLRSDTVVRIGTPVEVNGTGALYYEWLPNYNISSVNKPNVKLTPFKTTQYILTGKNSKDCFSSDTLNVIVIEDCGEMFIPNAFSPNKDGVNDVLYVRGICLKTLTFMVFNRWGEKVFETSNQSVGWDGTYKGEDLNSGVYVFRLEGRTYDGKSYSTKGNLTLIR